MIMEINGILYNLYTKAHHIWVRYYNKKEFDFNNWFSNYSFPVDDIDKMRSLLKVWNTVVYEYLEN